MVLFPLTLSGCANLSDSGRSSNTAIEPGKIQSSEEKPDAASEMPMAPSRSSRNTGGGGGGEADMQTVAATQVVTLNQAEHSRQPDAQTDRKIIRDAELNLESDTPEDAQKQIAAIAESKGGFVVETHQSSSNIRSSGRDTVNMTLRVPADKFAESVDEIRGTANRVLVENIKGQDVTEEFIDIESRQKAKRALESQFLEIMKRANSVEDAMNVQTQLAEVRGEIEQIEGRLRFLQNRIALSTIKVGIQTPAAISASGRGFFYRITEAAGTGFDAALDFVLGLITFVITIIPFLLFVGLPIFIGFRFVWRRLIRRQTAREIAGLEIQDS